MISKNRRLLALTVALIALVAACGSDSSAADNETTTTTTTTAAAEAEPFTIDLAVDAVGGQNLRLDLGDRQIDAPAEHAEVFVDGEPWMRLYTDWVHLKMPPGDHEVRVEFGGGEANASLTVPEADGMHGHSEPVAFAGDAPEIQLSVTEDLTEGWNLLAEVSNFRFAPEHASSEPVAGEGHAHVFVDGAKVQRLYGEWWHFADLTPGPHEVFVELNANNHAPYEVDGTPVTATAYITVAGDITDPVELTDGAEDQATLDVVFANGAVTGTDNRVKVEQGQTVMLTVTSDVAEHVHVHGYDLFLDLGPGDAATMIFTANIPGVFEIEFEESGVLIAEIEVR